MIRLFATFVASVGYLLSPEAAFAHQQLRHRRTADVGHCLFSNGTYAVITQAECSEQEESALYLVAQPTSPHDCSNGTGACHWCATPAFDIGVGVFRGEAEPHCQSLSRQECDQSNEQQLFSNSEYVFFAGVGSTCDDVFPFDTCSSPIDFLPEFTKQAIRNNTTSPQAKAWQWVEGHPEFGSMSTERKLQLMALSTLYYSTAGGEHWDPGFNGWLDASVSECNWQGGDNYFDPECTTHGEYQELNLGEDGLKGSIPPEISFLTGLNELRLFTNALTGTIPTELGALTALSGLKLSENSLTGPIPTELGALTSLTYLSLYKNALTGTIPTTLDELTALTTLSVHDNLLSGTAPSGLCDLRYLNIDCDRVLCTCPYSFYGLPNCGCN